MKPKNPHLKLVVLSFMITALLVTAAQSSAAGAVSSWTQRCAAPCVAPSARAWAPTVYDASTGTVVLFGGWGSTFTSDTWTWDGVRWAKQSPAVSPAAAAYGAMAYDASTKTVVLFVADKTWLWSGAAKTWTLQKPKTSPSARYFASMAYDPVAKRVLLFGGSSDYVRPLADTWTWDGAAKTWTRQTPSVSPPTRHHASMAYDPASGKVVLFGGQGATALLGDTWSWDDAAKTWTQQTPPVSPAARHDAAMSTDESAGRVVLFGGAVGGEIQDLRADTWTWDGSTKTWNLQTAAGPEARYGAAMASDPRGQGVMLFGGISVPSANVTGGLTCFQTRHLHDTWTYGTG